MKKNAIPVGRQGFTLIELIVSMTIIAVITVVTMVSFGGVNKRARDSRRMSDLQKVAVALEMYKQTVGTYPANLDLLKTNYIQEIPKDPKTAASYAYVGTNYTYTLTATVEDPGSTNVPGSYQIKNP